MNKLMLSLATLMLLALTSCGSDEPQDKIWYAQIPFVFHVVDQTEDVVSSCKPGVAYTEMNVDRKTAKMAVSVTLADGKELAFELDQLHVKQDASTNGYVVTSSTMAKASGHTITDITFFVDMRQSGTVRHYFHMMVDDRYEVNGLSASMGFEVTQSEVLPPSSVSRTVFTGIYEFTITTLTTESKTCAFSVKGLGVFPLDNGVTYQGLKVEPTVEGYTITSGDTPITPKEGGVSRLNNLHAKVNVHKRTFEAEFEVEQCATVTATGSIQ